MEVALPDQSLAEAARKMKTLSVGALPVGENDRLVGMITDRDMAIRAVAEERSSSLTKVRDAMTSPIVYCFDDQEIEEVARVMEAKQIRRLVVLNRKKRMVGILSLDDIANNEALAGEILSRVSSSIQRNKKAA